MGQTYSRGRNRSSAAVCFKKEEGFAILAQLIEKDIVGIGADRDIRLGDIRDPSAVVSHDGKRADKMYAQLTQALALLAGVCEGIEKEITESLFDESLIPVTLSCKPCVYEALLQEGQGYLQWIVRDIENVYGKMVLNGDTTFYETEKGADDFGLAGSLCHAWSAVACYIFNKYGEEIE